MSACRFDSSTHYQYPRPHPPRPQARDETRPFTIDGRPSNTYEHVGTYSQQSASSITHSRRGGCGGATPARHKTMHQLIKEEALRAAARRRPPRFYAAQSDRPQPAC